MGFLRWLLGVQPKVGDVFRLDGDDPWDDRMKLVVTDLKPGFVRFRYVGLTSQRSMGTREFLFSFTPCRAKP